MNMKNKSNESISNLLTGNWLITIAKQIFNYFNNFFTSIPEKNKQRHCQIKKPYLSYHDPENNNTIFLSPTGPEDIEDLISLMKTNTTSGPNSISISISISLTYSRKNFENFKWYDKYVFQSRCIPKIY